jgi:hypothetical protein
MRTKPFPAALLTGVLAMALVTVPAPFAHADDCLAGTRVYVPVDTHPERLPSAYDLLAVSPARSSYTLGAVVPGCYPYTDEVFVTVQRPDGSRRHEVRAVFVDQTWFVGHLGSDSLDYPTATGPWVASGVRVGVDSAMLTTPTSFRIKRATVATLTVKPTPAPTRPLAVGTVRYWTAGGDLAPSPGRTVYVRSKPPLEHWSGGTLLATTTTDAYGRYSVRLPITSPTWVHIEIPSTPTLGWFLTKGDETYMYHPTFLTGTAAPTTSTTITYGTTMSTYGHLRVTHDDGSIGPLPGQKVLVQTRPKSNPTGPYGTVATATTTSTGYYYANWKATVDADVRVAYLSPYKTITSAYHWIRSVDVQ